MLFALGLGLAFSYGFIVGKYEVFPYQNLKAVKHLWKNAKAETPQASFDEYRRLVEFPDKIEVPCPPQTEKTGVLLVIGQSNAANSAEKRVSTLYPEQNLNYFDGLCYASQSPLLGATGGSGEWLTLLGDHLIARGVYENVVLLSSAIGGSEVTRWAEGGDLNEMLLTTLRGTTDFYNITDVVWHQGETDVARFTHTITYMNMFESMMATLAKVGVTGPYFMSVASLCFGPDVPYPNRIAKAQWELIERHENIFLGVDTDDVVPRAGRYDGCHFGEKAQELVAAAIASSITRYRAGGLGSEELSTLTEP
jgi:hypothetical protein